MNRKSTYRSVLALSVLTLLLGVASSRGASAEDIGAANFGAAANGMPWAVALEKGFFKEAGVDITGVISSLGGGPDLRVLLGGNLPYAEAGLSAVAAANQAGADLVIVSDNVHTVSDILWVTRKDSPIESIKDLKGKKIAFSNPGSTTQALDYLLVDHAGFKREDVQFIAAGSLGAALTALENGGVDVAPMAEPAWTLNGAKYKTIARGSEIFPPISNTIGVTSRKTLQERPQVVRAIIQARRKAVEYMQANRKESAQLIAKHYKMDPAVIEKVMSNLMDHGTVRGVPYWGLGNFEYESLNNLVRAMNLIGVINGQLDWNKYVDESYLPADLQSKKGTK